MESSATAICLYRVRQGHEDEFTALLQRHWPTLHRLGLVNEARPQHYRGFERGGAPLFVEIFTWKSDAAAEAAHQHPDIMAIWEPMDKLTEPRDGRPNMEFPHVQPIRLLDET